MDERQQQIRERAGLEESRLNQDFIDFLQKWGSPLLMVVALAALGYVGWQKSQKREDEKVGSAFAALEAARSGENPSPDTLISVADEWKGRGAVPLLARREAADIYLDCAARGIKPGATVNADGTLANADDEVKTPEEREELLKQAEASYQWVVDQTGNDDDKSPHTMAGLYGLAAVAETRGDWDKAKGYYERVISIAERKGFANHVAIAKKRRDSLGELAKAEAVPYKSQVPPGIEQPKPGSAGADAVGTATRGRDGDPGAGLRASVCSGACSGPRAGRDQARRPQARRATRDSSGRGLMCSRRHS